MSQPFDYERSPHSCPRCHDPLTQQLGQNDVTGALEQVHFCGCGYVHVDRHSEALAQVFMTVEQIAERRLSALDRPEVVGRLRA